MMSRVLLPAWALVRCLGLGLACSVPATALGPFHGGAIRSSGFPNPVLGTGGTVNLARQDPGTWSQWWVLNRDDYLRRGEALYGGAIARERPDSRGGFAPGMRDWDEELRTRVMPEFLRILRREDDNELIASTAIAMAKMGVGLAPADLGAGGIPAALTKLLDHGNQEVRECAVLAWGLSEPATPLRS